MKKQLLRRCSQTSERTGK